MTFWVALILGIIIGWVAEWIYDVYVRGDSASLVELESVRNQLVAAEGRERRLQSDLTTALNREPEVVVKEVVRSKDRLQQIHGIGNVFAAKLNAAGIHTFADLSRTAPERLEEIIKPEYWQEIKPGAWIEQARQLAEVKGEL